MYYFNLTGMSFINTLCLFLLLRKLDDFFRVLCVVVVVVFCQRLFRFSMKGEMISSSSSLLRNGTEEVHIFHCLLPSFWMFWAPLTMPPSVKSVVHLQRMNERMHARKRYVIDNSADVCFFFGYRRRWRFCFHRYHHSAHQSNWYILYEKKTKPLLFGFEIDLLYWSHMCERVSCFWAVT